MENFNSIPRENDEDDLWLEQEFLAGLDGDVARYLTQLEHIQAPKSHVRRLQKEGWHLLHLLAPKHSVRLAMFIGAQMVRSPVWRDALHRCTALDMERTVKDRVKGDLAQATDPKERARLEELLGIRFVTTEAPKRMLVEMSGHLAYKLGQVLYERYLWSVHRFQEPALVIGNEPVVLMRSSKARQVGSFSDIALQEGVLSIYGPLEKMVEKAIEIVASCERVVLPFGPRHALVLNRLGHLVLPGRYDQDLEFAKLLNSMIAVSSTKWAAWTPGMNPQILDGLAESPRRRAA